MDGVPLSISNEKILTQQAHIHPYFPLVRVDVTADVVLFKPQLGTRLGEEGYKYLAGDPDERGHRLPRLIKLHVYPCCVDNMLLDQFNWHGTVLLQPFQRSFIQLMQKAVSFNLLKRRTVAESIQMHE